MIIACNDNVLTSVYQQAKTFINWYNAMLEIIYIVKVSNCLILHESIIMNTWSTHCDIDNIGSAL